MYTYQDTKFSLAIGLVDKHKRIKNMPDQAEISRYFRISGKTVKRAIGSGEDEEADEKTEVLGFHLCTKDDRKYFYDLRDLNTAHLDKVWSYLYCLDDPESVKF